MPSLAPAVVWFRDDLRIADNPALVAAVETGRPIVPFFLLDEVSPGIRPLGGAARWWLDRSLTALADALARLGSPLVLRRGPAAMVLPALVAEIGAGAVYWNRRWGGAEIAVDRGLKADLRRRGLVVESRMASLLHEPTAIRTGSGGPYRVFTPFWRACLAAPQPRAPLPAPAALLPPTGPIASDRLADWGLRPRAPDWSSGLAATWTPGERGAHARLDAFLERGLATYAVDRDRPDREATSRLSPHLRFGEISPFAVWAAVGAVSGIPAESIDKFRSEIGWREFAHHLLFHFPDMATRPLQSRFEAMPWRDDPAFVDAWKRGLTGWPLVDAGMRQLWETGWMHNRARMVAASFLVKHGLVDWRVGEAWFWDTLVDACPADNPAGWQWVAGCGADAAPFFRIFNPATQAAKFDPDGTFVRAVLGDAPSPPPIVDHVEGRRRALAALATLTGNGD